jgi:hypothetical protein
LTSYRIPWYLRYSGFGQTSGSVCNIVKCLTRNVKPWFCSISSGAKYMADFESTWMSNQHGRNSPEPSVFGAGQEVVINQVVKNPVSNLEVGSLRKPVNFIGSTRGHRSVFFIQGMPRSSYLWALRPPSSCRSSCRFCLRPGMGITLRSSPWFPIQVAMGTQGGERRFCSCSVSRIQLS